MTLLKNQHYIVDRVSRIHARFEGININFREYFTHVHAFSGFQVNFYNSTYIKLFYLF